MPVEHIPPARPEQIATRIGFFVAGLGMAAWAPLVPYAKIRIGLSDDVLGLLLLCLGAGSIALMPVAGAMAAKVGCRAVIVTATLAACIALPLLAIVGSLPSLVAALLLFGAAMGGIDVTINIQAIIVERASGRAMMSGFHGLFSLGGIVGAGGMTVLLRMGLSPFATILCVVAVLLLALALAFPRLLPYGAKNDGPAFAVPHGVVLLIGSLCFVLFLAEGSVLDWSGVFLTTVRHAAVSFAGMGYAAFATTMTLGRLNGDRIVQRFGGHAVIVFGGLCAAAGFAIAMLVPSWQVGLLGYALVGAGCSNIVPVLFSAVGRQTVMPETIAVPAITTLGYAGILAGPAAIGFIANAASLQAAFLILAGLLVGVAASGRWLRV